MQELRFVAVSEDGSYAVLAVPGRSARFSLPIDERLRAVALGQSSRLAQYEIEVESPLRPKEIQARIRAGETAEEIADAAGIPVERVRWFEGPVLAERAYIATQAQAASVRRAGDSVPGPRLGDIAPARISALGGDPEEADWDSRKRGDGNWQVSLSFISGGRLHTAEWTFDPRRRHVMPADEAAERLSLPESELPPAAASVPGEATVTPLAPRLGAVAAGGMTSGATSGGYSGGSRYRPDRGGMDRGTGMDRTTTERPAYDRGPAERPAYDRGNPERPAYEPPAAYERPAAYAPEPPAAYVSRSITPAEPPRTARPQLSPGGATPLTPRDTADAAPSRGTPPDSQATTSAMQAGYPPAYTPSPGHGLVPMWEPPAWDPTRAPAATEPAAPEPVPAAPDPTAPDPTAQAAAAPAAGQVAFDEEPEPVLSRADPPGTAHSPALPHFDDTEFAAASVYLEVAEPVSAEPAPAQPEVPLARPAATKTLPAETLPAETLPAETRPAETLPAKAKPTDPARAQAEPTKAEPAKAEPAKAKPATAGPAKAEPAKAEPVKAKPATAGPAEAVPAEPSRAEAAAAQALPAKPAAPEPVTREPVTREPATPEPVAEPVPAEAASPEAASPEAATAAQEAPRPRQPKNAKAKGRRSSVPSWDEIMLGSSRQRD